MRRIRRLVWENTNRVLGLVSGVRMAVLTAVATYGLAWFGFRVFDGVVLRLMGEPIRVNITWPGWDFLLPVVGVGAGIVALLRERALSEMLRGWRRAVVVALASLATLALAALVIPLGLRWQARQAGAAPAKLVTPLPSASQSGSPLGSAPLPSLGVASVSAAPAPRPNPSPSASPRPAPLATDEELRQAAARGVEGWLPLADRYPTDARVLRALVLAHASRAAELADAMLVARRLFQTAPEEAKNPDLQYLVQRAAETPGPPAEFAWKMLTEDMGPYGPDVLYALTLTKPKLADRAERLLGDPVVRQRTSPALAIARELRSAPSCAARLPLLERAVQMGDERALAVLAGLSTGTKRGCGKNKRKPCPAACPEQVDPFRAAIGKLSQRLKGGPR
jgi:hypothetical protein